MDNSKQCQKISEKRKYEEKEKMSQNPCNALYNKQEEI